MTTPPRRRMSWPFRLWFGFLALVAVGMIVAAVWSALVVMEAGPEGYRGMRGAPPPATAPANGPAAGGAATDGSTAAGRP